MALLNFRHEGESLGHGTLPAFPGGYSIEVTPRTAKRLRAEEFRPMRHFPAQIIRVTEQQRGWRSRCTGAAGGKQGLQQRVKDVTKLLTPFEPTDLVTEPANHKARHPDFGIKAVHFFPLGGIKTNATWIAEKTKG